MENETRMMRHPHQARATIRMSSQNMEQLRLESAGSIAWKDNVTLHIDAGLAYDIAAALAKYAYEQEREGKLKNDGKLPPEVNYNCARCRMFARKILDGLSV